MIRVCGIGSDGQCLQGTYYKVFYNFNALLASPMERNVHMRIGEGEDFTCATAVATEPAGENASTKCPWKKPFVQSTFDFARIADHNSDHFCTMHLGSETHKLSVLDAENGNYDQSQKVIDPKYASLCISNCSNDSLFELYKCAKPFAETPEGKLEKEKVEFLITGCDGEE